jgi:hypothetical protein
LLEKEHYGEIMEKFLDINKNFLLFLCKDTDYGDILTGKIECEGKENDRFKEMTFLKGIDNP